MKNTRFTHPQFGLHQLGKSSITLPGYAPISGWVLVPMLQVGGFACPDWSKPHRPLHYAGSRAEVARCLLSAGWELVE